MSNKIEKFEDLNVWKESIEHAKVVYKSIANLRDFGLKDQMQRAAVSIPSNISEGFERQSNKDIFVFSLLQKVHAVN